jgi:hypothetical protein
VRCGLTQRDLRSLLGMRPLGAAEQPLIEWVNRPTFQQVVEITRKLPR